MHPYGGTLSSNKKKWASKLWKENRTLIKDVIGPKHFRTHKMLGYGSRWFVSNFLVWQPLLMTILRKIFRFKAKANNN